MRCRGLLLVLVVVTPFGCRDGARSALPSDAAGTNVMLVISDVTVIDVSAASAALAHRPHHTVAVEGSRIAAVEPTSSFQIPRGARVVSGQGLYLIPGLWDAHAHVSDAGEAALAAYVAHGVTSVRDLGARLTELRVWRERIGRGELTGPRLYMAGPNVEGAWWLDRVESGGLPGRSGVLGSAFATREDREPRDRRIVRDCRPARRRLLPRRLLRG